MKNSSNRAASTNKNRRDHVIRDNPAREPTFSNVCVECEKALCNDEIKRSVSSAEEFDQRASDCLATPFPPTLAARFLGQVKLEKNCLANGTASHPHGFSPLIPSISKKEGSRIVCRVPLNVRV